MKRTLLVYLFGAVLTWGYAATHPPEGLVMTPSDTLVTLTFVSAVWPLYWSCEVWK
ncbi:MAG: hypothetical protein KGJ38_08225 [Burkholderiaceae bacterium]|nr:hypothetical protein [Burkholderiaceae bacterium]